MKRFRFIGFIGVIGLAISIVSYYQPSFGATLPALTLDKLNIGEGDDFASQNLGLPWDMESPPYPDFPTVFHNVDRGSFSANSDDWTFSSTNNDPNLWMLWPNIADSQDVLRMGDRFPIDASHYRLLSFRLCSNLADVANVYWYDAPLGAPVVPAGDTEFILTQSGCHLYVMDLATIPKFSGTWGGWVSGLRLDPAASNSSVDFTLHWVRLTSVDPTHTVGIQWNDVVVGSDLEFYLNDSCSMTDAMLIGTQQNVNPSGTFEWGAVIENHPSEIKQVLPIPASIEPGSYVISMIVNGTGAPICTLGNLEIVRAPSLNFLKPSPFSGPDYATTEVGDPWGMNNPEDIPFEENLSGSSFGGGIFTGTSLAAGNPGSGDPALYLNTPTSIDTSRYHYVTFRYYLEGEQDIAVGWVLRYLWYTINTVDLVTIEDMIIYEGWHTYWMDLSQVLIDPVGTLGTGWHGYPTTLRMDPHEIPFAETFHLDFITLSGDEKVLVGMPFSIIYEIIASQPVAVTFYYDDDRDLSNGRVAMQQFGVPGFKVFLPFVINSTGSPDSPEIDLPAGETWIWDTTGIAPGIYYASAEVSDGMNTTNWYSETPIIIE